MEEKVVFFDRRRSDDSETGIVIEGGYYLPEREIILNFQRKTHLDYSHRNINKNEKAINDIQFVLEKYLQREDQQTYSTGPKFIRFKEYSYVDIQIFNYNSQSIDQIIADIEHVSSLETGVQQKFESLARARD